MVESVRDKWWSDGAVAVVTGSNRGIGHEIARQLATNGFTIVLTDKISIEDLSATAAKLEEELRNSFAATGSSSFDDSAKPSHVQPRVFCHPLDIRSSESVLQLATWLKEKFGQISVLVNSAGIGFRRIPYKVDQDTGDRLLNYEIPKDTLETNFWGTKRVTEALLPLMNKTSPEGSRIIFITSRLGTYMVIAHSKPGPKIVKLDGEYSVMIARNRSETIEKLERLKGCGKETLGDVDRLSEDKLDEVGRKYLEDAKADRLEQAGWIAPSDYFPAYSESKMLVSAYMLLLAKKFMSNGEPGSILVSAACPGPTNTAMVEDGWRNELLGMGWTMKSLAEGADTPVWLTLLPRDGYPHGKLFAERAEFSYDLDDLF